MLTIELVREAKKNIEPYVLRTPLVFSNFLSEKTGKKVYLKLETQQYTSSFKPRPAFNSILTHFENVICILSGANVEFSSFVKFLS